MQVEVVVAMLEAGDVGVTTSSRHWGVLDWGFGVVRGRDPVGVVRVWDVSFGFGATDWKAWIGSASKNSWAKIKGVLLGSRDKSIELELILLADETVSTVWYKSNVFTPCYRDP